MKIRILIYLSLIFIVLFIGILIGFYIHKEQPRFYKIFKDQLVYGILINDRQKIIETILNNETEKETINQEKFKNLFKTIALSSYNKCVLNCDELKDQFLIENILDKNVISVKETDKKTYDLLRNLYLPKDLDEKFKIYESKTYNLSNLGVLHKSKKSKKLLIYNHGHNGNAYDFSFFLKIKKLYLDKDFDVLVLSMPIRGMNLLSNREMSFPVNPYKNILPNFDLEYKFYRTNKHNIFRNFYDKNYPNKKPLSIFLSGNYFLIKKIIQLEDYEEIKFIGHSGGGLLGLYYMYLIPEIKESYFASSFFTKTHRIDFNGGDWEHYHTDFIKKNTYFDLIFGSLIDGNNKFSRKIIFQFNRYDPTCCGYPHSKNFSFLINKLGKELDIDLKSIYLKIDTHTIDIKTIKREFN